MVKVELLGLLGLDEWELEEEGEPSLSEGREGARELSDGQRSCRAVEQ